MAKSIRKNYIYNTAYQILLLITPLITTPYISRVMGADGVGIYSYTHSISTYFIMFAILGTSTFGQREISYVQQDEHRRSVVFWETFGLRCVTSALAAATYIVFCLFQTENVLIYEILILDILGVATDVSWFFQGLEEFGKVVGRNALFKAINIAFIFLCVHQKSDLALYVFGMSFLGIVGNVSLWPFLRHYIMLVPRTEIHVGRHLPTVISLFIPTVAVQVYTVFDKTMLGLIVGSDTENGYYEQSQKMANMALTLVTSLGTVMIPRIGALWAEGKKDEVAHYMYRSYRFVWMLGLPLAAGLAACASNLVPWFFGPGFDEVVPLLWIFSLQILAIGNNNVTGLQYLVPTGRQNLLTLAVCIGAGVDVAMNALLIPRWASIGAAISSVAAETVIAVVMLYFVRDELDACEVVRTAPKYLIASGIMFAVLWTMGSQLSSGIVHTLLMIAIGIVVYAVVLWLLRDDFYLETLDRLRTRLHRVRV